MDYRKEAELSGWRHVRRRYSWLAKDALTSCFFLCVSWGFQDNQRQMGELSFLPLASNARRNQLTF